MWINIGFKKALGVVFADSPLILNFGSKWKESKKLFKVWCIQQHAKVNIVLYSNYDDFDMWIL